jgi:hypothetical protein
MTLAEFYALQSSPQAIIVPRRSLRTGPARRMGQTVAAAGADANSTASIALPDDGADKKH